MGEFKRCLAVVFASALVLVLVGCSGGSGGLQAPGAGGGAEHTSGVPAEPTPDTGSWPVPLISVGCDDLVPRAVRDGLFGQTLHPTPGWSNGADAQNFSVTAFTNVGGLSCAWRGEPGTDNPEDEMLVVVQVLPRSGVAAARIAEEMDSIQVTSDANQSCDWRSCSLNTVVAEYWIGATVHGLPEPTDTTGVPASVTSVFESVLATMRAVPASAEPVMPGDAASWPDSCAQLIPASALPSALGFDGASFATGYAYEGSNVGSGAILTAGGLVCGLSDGAGSRVGAMKTLPASDGAFENARASALQNAAGEGVQVDGLGADDAYIYQPDSVSGRVTVNLKLDGTWIELSMVDDASDGTEISTTDRLLRLAGYLASTA